MDSNIMSMIITHGMPLVKTFVIQQITNDTAKKTIELDNEKTTKQYNLYNKYKHLDNQQTHVPVDNSQDDSPQMTKEEIGRQMWDESHQSVEDLDDSADEQTVKKTMKKIEKSFKKHPCMECQIQAKKNLKELPITKSKTKDEAKQTLCQFHNKVNDDLGKPQFDCNSWSF
jgi:FAD-linked sulfhydryl oxidase